MTPSSRWESFPEIFRGVPALGARINPARAKGGWKKKCSLVICVCRVHCSKKRIPPHTFRYYRETQSYLQISEHCENQARPKILSFAALSLSLARRKFAQVKFRRQAKKNENPKILRTSCLRERTLPFSFFAEPVCATLFNGNLETSQKMSILMTMIKIFS